jgi:hypothetical protein
MAATFHIPWLELGNSSMIPPPLNARTHTGHVDDGRYGGGQAIISGTMAELLLADFGGPLHSFIIPGEMHPMEEEMLAFYRPPATPTVKPTDSADRI